MLLLIVASCCLAACVYVVTQVIAQPERDRRSLVRRAAHYGCGSHRSVTRRNAVAPRTRPRSGGRRGSPGSLLRMNRRESLEQVQQRLLAAGMNTVSPSGFLAAKGLLAGVGGAFIFGICPGVAERNLARADGGLRRRSAASRPASSSAHAHAIAATMSRPHCRTRSTCSPSASRRAWASTRRSRS